MYNGNKDRKPIHEKGFKIGGYDKIEKIYFAITSFAIQKIWYQLIKESDDCFTQK